MECHDARDTGLPRAPTGKRLSKSTTTVDSDDAPPAATHCSREAHYLSMYAQTALLAKIPDVSNCLARTTIDGQVRARVVNWMVEVLCKTAGEACHASVFRSVLLLDLYFKHSERVVDVQRVQLAAITAVYLACKYESASHHTAAYLCERACYGKFTKHDIFATEIEMLKTLGFTLKHTTALDMLYLYLHHYFNAEQPQFGELRDLCTSALMRCVVDDKMVSLPMAELCTCVLVVCVQTLFGNMTQKAIDVKDTIRVSFLAEQEKLIIKSIIRDPYSAGVNFSSVSTVSAYLDSFERRFQECTFVIETSCNGGAHV